MLCPNCGKDNQGGLFCNNCGSSLTGTSVSPGGIKEDPSLATLAHVLGLITGFIGPLIIYLVKSEEGFVKDQAREALNFQITIVIAGFVSVILMAVLIGIVLIIVVGVIDVIFCIMAAVSASKGERYRYPINIRFIKG